MTDRQPSRYFVFVNQYASTPETGMGGRHYLFARELVRMGHRVDLVMASHHHLLHSPRRMAGGVEIVEQEGIRLIYLRMPKYPGAHSRRRVLNWLLFTQAVARLRPHLRGRPDSVLVSSPSPFAYLGAERLARRFRARLCFEVRDIWPLSLIELRQIPPTHPLVRVMQSIEDRAYRNADAIISNLPGVAEHIAERGGSPARFTLVPNGFAHDFVDAREPLDDGLAARFGEGGFVVGYAGTLGLANALDTLLDAAALLREHSDIRFVLVGSGREQAGLERRIAELELSSVVLPGVVPRHQVPAALARFDLCYIGWQPSPIYRFGIAANKIPEYMMAAKPILHAYSGYADPVAEAQCGATVPAGDANAVAAAILRLRDAGPSALASMGASGRRYAEGRYDYAVNARALCDILAPNG